MRAQHGLLLGPTKGAHRLELGDQWDCWILQDLFQRPGRHLRHHVPEREARVAGQRQGHRTIPLFNHKDKVGEHDWQHWRPKGRFRLRLRQHQHPGLSVHQDG